MSATTSIRHRLRRQIKRLGRPAGALRAVRVVVSLTMLALMTVALTTGEAALARRLGWVAAIQIVPLTLAGATTGLVAWLAATMVLGRVYCSTVCPLGALQDVAARSRRIGRGWKSRRPYHYTPPKNILRGGVLVVTIACALLGFALIPSLLDPYSAYGRIGSELLRPVAEWVAGDPVAVSSWLAFAVAAVTLAGVWITAAASGRTVCNTICPVGSLLGILSRNSILHFDIDTDLCTNCRSCERVCKSRCISLDDHLVDGSRCVVCFDCADACPEGAIRYTTRRKRLSTPLMQRIGRTPSAAVDTLGGNAVADKPVTTPDTAGSDLQTDDGRRLISRRQFMATGLIVAASAIPAVAIAGEGMRRVARATGPASRNGHHLRPVAPPGRRSMRDFLESCTACGLCVSHCPTGVLRPSVRDYGLSHSMQPVMRYGTAYCDFDCTLCTDLCPTGALIPLTVDEKHIFIIGHAEVDTDACIACGRCQWSCPRKAVQVTDADGTGRHAARVDTTLCIGCGVCQSVCPVTPQKAIMVNGII